MLREVLSKRKMFRARLDPESIEVAESLMTLGFFWTADLEFSVRRV